MLPGRAKRSGLVLEEKPGLEEATDDQDRVSALWCKRQHNTST